MNRRRFLEAGCLAAATALGSRHFSKAFPAIPAARPQSQRARLTVLWGDRVGKISRHVYGNFAEHLGGCIYDAMWVGTDSAVPNVDGLRKDTIEALKRIQAPMIRWPGGCFADAYHWRDGIGPREKRPKTWNIWWGRDESNAFGTDEFLQYCKLSGTEPHICFNVGSGTVQEAMEWLEYCNSDQGTAMAQLRSAHGHPEPYNVRYWSVGNENWGCGGNFDPEDYAREYARFVTFLGRMARGTGVEFIACGDFRGDWNQKFFETLLERLGARGRIRGVNHLSVHHYFRGGPAVKFTDEEYYNLLASVGVLEERIKKTIGVINHYTSSEDPPIGISLDEWGVWHPSEGTGARALFQSNTLRDALLAAVVFNSLNQLGSAVSIANIAQTFNVLQCLAFTEGEKFVLTPTYDVFDLYQPHMEATALKVVVDSPTYAAKARTEAFGPPDREITRDCLSASASLRESEKKVCVTLVNQHLTEPLETEIHLAGLEGQGVRGGSLRELTSANVRDENTFEAPRAVGPPTQKQVSFEGNRFVHVIPAHCIQTLLLEVA